MTESSRCENVQQSLWLDNVVFKTNDGLPSAFGSRKSITEKEAGTLVILLAVNATNRPLYEVLIDRPTVVLISVIHVPCSTSQI